MKFYLVVLCLVFNMRCILYLNHYIFIMWLWWFISPFLVVGSQLQEVSRMQECQAFRWCLVNHRTLSFRKRHSIQKCALGSFPWKGNNCIFFSKRGTALPLLISFCPCRHSRNIDQPSNQDAHVQLSAEERLAAEEKLAAEESLSIYCQPIELYNILHRRARKNVLHLIG